MVDWYRYVVSLDLHTDVGFRSIDLKVASVSFTSNHSNELNRDPKIIVIYYYVYRYTIYIYIYIYIYIVLCMYI